MAANVGIATSSALGAAALFALGSTMQARALRVVPGVGATDARPAGRFSPLMVTELRLVTRALPSRAWVAGTAMAALAFGLHALALHEGDLSLVQPLLVTIVLFALPAGRVVSDTRVTGVEWVWALVLLLGLTAFFIAADPLSPGHAGVDAGPALVVAAVGGLTVLGCVGMARRRSSGSAAALLGSAAGIAFAGMAALVKVLTGLFGQGVGAVVASWQMYAALALGTIGVFLSQLAYRVGPLSASLPALNSVNALAGVAIGVVVFHERFRTGLVASGVEVVGLVVMTVAVVALSRRPRVEYPYPATSRAIVE
jgi:drug/metabolite transporter (DMT)-like permease